MIINSEAQRDILREGGKRLSEIRNILAEKTVAGVSTAELDALAYELCTKRGDKPAFLNYSPQGAPRPFPASICVSINDVVVHGIPTENPQIIKEGDLVSIDIGLIHEGLITDSAITVSVGEVTSREKEMLIVAERALYSAIDVAEPGVRIDEVSTTIEKIARGKGFGIPVELGGHGVGEKVHEDPSVPNVSYGDNYRLKEGEVIAIEPIITLGGDGIVMENDGYTIRTQDGSKSAHIEHTIIVTEGGAEILTT